jgi:Rieske Fe-S protein
VLEGEIFRCPCHGSAFSVKTGDVINGPAKKPEPSYPVTVVEGDILFAL